MMSKSLFKIHDSENNEGFYSFKLFVSTETPPRVKRARLETILLENLTTM